VQGIRVLWIDTQPSLPSYEKKRFFLNENRKIENGPPRKPQNTACHNIDSDHVEGEISGSGGATIRVAANMLYPVKRKPSGACIFSRMARLI